MELTHFSPEARAWAKPRRLLGWTLVLLGAACAVVYAVRPAPRAVTTPLRKDVTASFSCEGTIHSGQAFLVRAPLEGQIGKLAVKPGQRVQEGDLLYAYDPTELRQAIHDQERAIHDLQAEQQSLNTHEGASDYRQATHDLEVATRQLAALKRQGHETEDDRWTYQQAVDRYRDARAQLWQQQADLGTSIRDARRDLAELYARLPRLTRRSPAAGLVAELYVGPGERVTVHSPLLRIEDPRQVTVSALVDEKDRFRVRAGQGTRIEVAGTGSGTPAGTGTFAGRVTRVTPGTDAELWQAWVTIRAAGTPCAFHDGQPVTVRVITNTFRHALVLPAGAVRAWRTGAVVYVTSGGSVEERVVKAVPVDTGEIAILAGLKPSERVLLTANSAHEGRRVVAAR